MDINNKVNVICRWIQKYDVDGFFGVESNLNWKMMPQDGKLPELFRSKNAIHTVTGHNTHKNFGHRQQGGTFGMVFGQLASRVKDVGSNEAGLGCWSWILMQGRDGHKTRIVITYQPCTSNAQQLGTVHAQHWQYLDSKGRKDESPCSAFHTDLVEALLKW